MHRWVWRKVLLGLLVFPGFSPAPAGEILNLQVVDAGQVEITFESREDTVYEVHGSEDLRVFSMLTRVQGLEVAPACL